MINKIIFTTLFLLFSVISFSTEQWSDVDTQDKQAVSDIVDKDIEQYIPWYGFVTKGLGIFYNGDMGYGLSKAYTAMGYMYFYGRGIPKDINKALIYFVAATIKGGSESSYMVGRIFYEGIGVEENIDLALEQFTLASERGYKKAEKYLDKIRKDMEQGSLNK